MKIGWTGALVLLCAGLGPALVWTEPSSAAPSDPVLSRSGAPALGDVPADFDGDSFGDLALATEGLVVDQEADGSYNLNVVHVVYGSAGGLSTARTQNYTALDFGGSPSWGFGLSLGTGDFNGDAFSDLAIGDPSVRGGQIRVLYGSRAGLTKAGSEVWSKNTPGIKGVASDDEEFGGTLVAANFGRGPQDDLAIGTASQWDGGGTVHVIFGSSNGLRARGSQLWTQQTRGVRGVAVEGDAFGRSLAAGRFAGSTVDDLAVGAPSYDGSTDRHEYAGAVNVLRGSRTGLTAKGDQLITQDFPGLAGSTDIGDGFGTTLAAGNFGRDGGSGKRFDDLVVSVPGETHGPHHEAVVHVLNGSAEGLTGVGSRTLLQGMAEEVGRERYADMNAFGLVLAAGSFGRDGDRSFADLVIGNPYLDVDVNGSPCSGLFNVEYGAITGLQLSGRQLVCPADLDGPRRDGRVFGVTATGGQRSASWRRMP